MKRKSRAFLLAMYLFISSSLCGCFKLKKNDDETAQKVVNIDKNESKELQDIIEETIGSFDETIQVDDVVIEETEPITIEPELTIPVITEPIFTEPEVHQPEKTIDELALEIIGNKYGFGEQRKKAVIEQGFDYNEVARRVDQILSGASYTIPDRNTYHYNFAYAPYTINVYDVDGNIEGVLTQYQKVIILDEFDDYYFVSFYNQTFYVKKDEIRLLADSHLELDISEQKVYMYFDGICILSADVITGHPGKGTTLGTNLGLSQVYSISYDVSFEGGKKSKYFILFNWDGEGFHDADWREDWEYEDKERYIEAGSNGCCNMKEDEVVIIEQNAYIGMPVLIHR